MLFSILAIGLVGAIGVICSWWIGKKYYTGEPFIDLSQNGNLYKGYWEDLDVASPRHHD